VGDFCRKKTLTAVVTAAAAAAAVAALADEDYSQTVAATWVVRCSQDAVL